MDKYQLTKEGLGALEKVAREGAKRSSASLSKLTNQEFEVQTLAVRSLPVEKIQEMIGSPEEMVTAVIMEVRGDVNGNIVLVYPQQSAMHMADLLTKRELGATKQLDELDRSALKESSNIISGSFLSAISNYLSINIVESIPYIATDMLQARVNFVLAFAEREALEAVAFKIDFEIGTSAVAENIKAYLVLILDVESVAKVLESLKKISGGLEEKVEERTMELSQNMKELREARSAMFSLLEDLNISKAKDEALLASIGDGVIATDQDGNIVMLNPQGEAMLGWKAQDIYDRAFAEAVPAQDEKGHLLPPDKNAATMALSTGKKVVTTTTSSYSFVRKDKTAFPVAITATPIILNGKTFGAIVVFRDITEEKEIDRAKSEFVSLASHQLRSPLSAINWYLELFLAGDVGKITDKQREYIKEAYQAGQHMTALVRTLLNVSRIELGTFDIEPEPTNLREIAESVLGELEPQIKDKKLELTKKYDPAVPVLNADPNLVRIVFHNLLSNAVKYTPLKGSITLEIKRQDPDVLIRVTDTGYGIPKDQQKRVFTKLFRAENILDKEPEGTGLGLYIAKSVIEHAGGTIWFTSEENKGTSFFVSLPLKGMEKKSGTKALT